MSSDDDSSDFIRPQEQLTKNSVVGHYRIIEKLGTGGMGEVYLAEDIELNRKVALKFLPSHLCHDAECRSRFKREAQAAAKLNHPNIVTIHEVSEFKGRPGIVMEHLEGLTLERHLIEKRPNLEETVDLAMQVCEGLQEAHSQGIVHRDIKPANILIDKKGRAKILDFGLAIIKGADKVTKAGSTLGTVSYMSPEQTRGEELDSRSDIFSLGVVLYQMITGQLPFRGDHEPAVIYAIGFEEPEPLARFKSGVPPELQRIVSKSLAKDPALRYQHADELLADLKRCFKRELSPVDAKSRFDYWNRYVVTSAVAVLLVIAGYWVATTYFISQESKSDTKRKMLAVLPFENLGSPEDDYFADGMTEEITTCLIGLSGLGVISRTSSMQYKKTEKSLRQIGKELNVDFVLEGTIRWDKRSTGSRVRINPQLIRVSDDLHLWAESYDTVLTDLFGVQSTIAREVAAALDVALLQSEDERLSRKIEVDPKAYDYYLRGKKYFSIAGYHHKEVRLAEKMQLKAIELAPDFAQAHAELGLIYAEMYWEGTDPSEECLKQARRMIDKALALAPHAAESHQALGWYYYHGLRDFGRALDEFSRVLELQPNNAMARASMAWVQRRQGKWKEAIDGLQTVVLLDPREAWYKYELGFTYFYCRRYHDAIARFDEVIDLQPNTPAAYLVKSFALLNLTGETRQAREALDDGKACTGRTPQLTWFEVYYDFCDKDYEHAFGLLTSPGVVLHPNNPDSSDYYFMKGACLSKMKKLSAAEVYFDSARVKLESRLAQSSESAALLSSLARVYTWLGKSDKAIESATRATRLLPVSADALTGPDYILDLAMVYAQTGHEEKAMELLDYLLSIPNFVSVNALKLLPEFNHLHSNPRFQELLKKDNRSAI